jgi:hypothetical protein
VDGAILGGSKVVVTRAIICREVNRKTASIDEGHATFLLFLEISASVYIFLIWVGFTF